MAINIREANLNDLAILVNNNQALAKETEALELNKNILREGVKQALKRKECHYFVAMMDGNVVGQSMITYEWSDWRNGMMWWIQSVYVPKEHRRQGVYTKMYNNLLELAQLDSECCGIRLYVEKENKKAQKTYEKLDMKNAGYEIMEFNKN